MPTTRRDGPAPDPLPLEPEIRPIKPVLRPGEVVVRLEAVVAIALEALMVVALAAVEVMVMVVRLTAILLNLFQLSPFFLVYLMVFRLLHATDKVS